jgi:hypothetical protein
MTGPVVLLGRSRPTAVDFKSSPQIANACLFFSVFFSTSDGCCPAIKMCVALPPPAVSSGCHPGPGGSALFFWRRCRLLCSVNRDVKDLTSSLLTYHAETSTVHESPHAVKASFSIGRRGDPDPKRGGLLGQVPRGKRGVGFGETMCMRGYMPLCAVYSGQRPFNSDLHGDGRRCHSSFF